jgi:integrase/recombinase XerD
MSELGRHIDEYLAMRRAVGFKLQRTGRLLADFAGFVERTGVETVTVDVAVTWARLPANASPAWAAQRLGVVRVFARYLATVDPDAEVPSADLLPARVRRITPYLYSDADITELMAAARTLSNPLKAATFETLIGLLATTGLRGGEAMHLDRHDLDMSQSVLIVRDTKFGKSRLVHLHDSTLQALHDYGVVRTTCARRRRQQACSSPRPGHVCAMRPSSRCSAASSVKPGWIGPRCPLVRAFTICATRSR